MSPAACGNQVFLDDYHMDRAPTCEAIKTIVQDKPTAASYQTYRARMEDRLQTRPVEQRRYFHNLEEATISPMPQQAVFVPQLAKRTTQVERMDMNILSGKNSLFLSNQEDDDLDDSSGQVLRTDSGGKVLISFSNESFLGEGRSSVVHRAKSKPLGESAWREVAVKLSLKGELDSLESLQHEIGMLKTMECPSIIRLHGTITLKRNKNFDAGFLMDLAQFGTLESFVQAKDVFSLSLNQFLSWSHQLLVAVQALQASRVTHFDVKPQNILVMEDYSLKLCDFGESIRNAKPDFETTRGRGTLSYNAPELLSLESTGTCDGAAVDMYGAGLVMYSLLTGRLPWHGLQLNAVHLMLIIRKGFLESGHNPLPSVSEGFRLPGPNGEKLEPAVLKLLTELVEGCTRPKPSERMTVDEATAKLRDVLLVE